MIHPDADLRTTLTDCTSAHSLEPSMHRTGIDGDVRIEPLHHYCNDSACAEWLAAMREMESEGERPVQEPHPVVMNIFTPMFLRRQAG